MKDYKRVNAFVYLPLILCAESAVASCANVTEKLFGFSLGPIVGYPENLSKGIEREGSAEIVENVGFESLEGESRGIRFDRIMVYVDRGRFIAYDAIGFIPRERDRGKKKVVELVEKLAGEPMKTVGTGLSISCGEGVELTVSDTTKDGGVKRVRISVEDSQAQIQMRDYVGKYCADEKRVRPQDACKRAPQKGG